MTEPLNAPFPYFGGKRQVADLVWRRLGEVTNYLEPFAGSLAVLLRRPAPGKVETVNDANHYLTNFWRAVTAAPEEVAEYSDWPVTEADMHVRHNYLLLSPAADDFRSAVTTDPEYYNAKFAGWWVWGQCCWIGSGWCDESGFTQAGNSQARKPNTCRGRGRLADNPTGAPIPDLAGHYGATGRGLASSAGYKKMPRLAGRGATESIGTGVTAKRPRLAAFDGPGTGVHANAATGLCDERRAWLLDWMLRLQDRLRMVRVCYGHWARICNSETAMTRIGTTGVFLDPPYAKDLGRLRQWKAHLAGDGPPPEAKGGASNRADGLYAGDVSQDIDRLVAEVNQWCRKWGADPQVRVALCGYEGEHDDLEALGWSVEAWKAHGGYANRSADNANKARERIWFSPACESGGDEQRELF